MSKAPAPVQNPRPTARHHRRAGKTEHFFHGVLHFLERAIATITLLVLLAALAVELYNMVVTDGYLSDINTYLHNILTIVVGLEFVRMLIDTTPASILEVLTVAITRHVILSHDDPISNIASVACIAGLFAIRRFLIPKGEMGVELSEVEDEEDEDDGAEE